VRLEARRDTVLALHRSPTPPSRRVRLKARRDTVLALHRSPTPFTRPTPSRRLRLEARRDAVLALSTEARRPSPGPPRLGACVSRLDGTPYWPSTEATPSGLRDVVGGSTVTPYSGPPPEGHPGAGQYIGRNRRELRTISTVGRATEFVAVSPTRPHRANRQSKATTEVRTRLAVPSPSHTRHASRAAWGATLTILLLAAARPLLRAWTLVPAGFHPPPTHFSSAVFVPSRPWRLKASEAEPPEGAERDWETAVRIHSGKVGGWESPPETSCVRYGFRSAPRQGAR